MQPTMTAEPALSADSVLRRSSATPRRSSQAVVGTENELFSRMSSGMERSTWRVDTGLERFSPRTSQDPRDINWAKIFSSRLRPIFSWHSFCFEISATEDALTSKILSAVPCNFGMMSEYNFRAVHCAVRHPKSAQGSNGSYLTGGGELRCAKQIRIHHLFATGLDWFSTGSSLRRALRTTKNKIPRSHVQLTRDSL